MTAEGNNIVRSVRAYNTQQQVLNNELALCANYNVAGIPQQLAAIQASVTALQASVAAHQATVAQSMSLNNAQ